MTDGQAKLVGVTEEPGALVLRLDTGEELTVAPNAVPPDLLIIGGSLGSSHLHLLREALCIRCFISFCVGSLFPESSNYLGNLRGK